MKLSFEKGFFAPLPVLIIGTYDSNGTPDAMNAAWGGQVGMSQISLSLSASHKTTENIKLNKEFTIAYATAEQIAASILYMDEPEKKEVQGHRYTGRIWRNKSCC